MSSGAATVGDIETAARRLTRELPEAHWFTKFLRQSKFYRAARRLRDLAFRVDPVTLTDDEFDEIPRRLEQGIKALEIHMLENGDQEMSEVLIDLRSALEGIQCGLHGDPSKRPSREEMTQRAGKRALEILQNAS